MVCRLHLRDRSAERQGSPVSARAPLNRSRSGTFLLDGVRAVAVLVSDAFFPFRAGWLPGGYMGADVFFVLPVLITTLLIQNTPTLPEPKVFWEQRA